MQLTLNRIAKFRALALGVFLAALMAASLTLAAKPAHASTTFTVDSTADYGDQTPGDGKCDVGTIMVVGERCTLRAAIQEANASSGADVVEFGIAGTGAHTISPTTELPRITGPVTINGYSQPGAQPNQKAVGSDAVLNIVLSGASASNAYSGLEIGASNSTIKGLVINRWQQGIRIDGPNATGNRIAGNYIGTDASGTQDLGNTTGVRVYEGSYNTIGGATAAARNVISGNGGGVGIGDGGPNTTGNKVAGNYIGTDATGTKDLGNSDNGVYTEDSTDVTTNSIIGGATAAERNVISGNDESGVGLSGSGSKVAGNFIGTDATGTKDLANGYAGVHVYDASNNTIGGTTAGERNVISGNDGSGVSIYGPNAKGNEVTGNFIGTDKNGAAILGNSANGVSISSSSNNTVGGTAAGARNLISDNDGSGVSIFGNGTAGNRVLSNSIFSNGGLGIDLGDDGPTPNDPDDADTGPNYLQNFPVLSSARKNSSGTTTVRGKLDSTPDQTFRVQFFINPRGTDEGKTFLGSQLVSTDGSGDATFTFATKKVVRLGQNVTATATGPGGNTSEFSAPKQVVAS